MEEYMMIFQWGGVILALIVGWSLIGYPMWNVWASHQAGLADLQRAKNEQQIQVAKAQGRIDAANLNKQARIIEAVAEGQARLDAAELNKKAAVIEAQAVALQIKEIGEQLTHHDLYLRWQWIKMMEEVGAEGTQTIYVPTETQLPILEAMRLEKQ